MEMTMSCITFRLYNPNKPSPSAQDGVYPTCPGQQGAADTHQRTRSWPLMNSQVKSTLRHGPTTANGKQGIGLPWEPAVHCGKAARLNTPIV